MTETISIADLQEKDGIDNPYDALANELLDFIEERFVDASVKKLRTLDDQPTLLVSFGDVGGVTMEITVEPLAVP